MMPETVLREQEISKVNQSSSKIRFGERFGYGLGDFAGNIIYSAITSFLIYYYTNVSGIAAGIVGTIMLVTRVFDAFVDIGMGILVDRTKSKHGKARPWILWMAIPFAVATVLLFSVPNIGITGKVIYAVVTYNVVNIIFSCINIPYGVLGTLISQDQYERSVLNIFRMFLSTVCSVFIGMETLPVVNAFGGGSHAWTLTFSIFGIAAAILFFVTFKSTKERVQPSVKAEKAVPIKLGVKALFKNKYWFLMLLFMVFAYISLGLGGANVYYVQYVLGNTGLMGTLTMAQLIPMLVTMLFIAPVIKRFGKRNSMILGFTLSILANLLIAINPTNVTLVIIGKILGGISNAPLAGSMFAMLADTVEYGEWKSGVRTEGLIYSAGSFGQKVGAGLGSAFVGWILSMGGYIAGKAVQTPSALLSLKVLFIYMPLMINIICLVIMVFYKLDREYPRIIKELKASR